MASVAAGKVYATKESSLHDNMCPPHGYHSVVGEVRLSEISWIFLWNPHDVVVASEL